MYVHVYKKTKRDKLGACAHFCPFCREMRAFDVSAVGTVTTVNGIPVSSMTRLHDELVCRECRVAIGFPRDQVRPVPVFTPGLEKNLDLLADVAERTSPWGLAGLMERLDLEARLANGRVTAEERKWLVSEAFEATEYSAGLGLPGNAPVEGNKQVGLAFLILLFILSAFASVIVWAVVVVPGGAGGSGWVGWGGVGVGSWSGGLGSRAAAGHHRPGSARASRSEAGAGARAAGAGASGGGSDGGGSASGVRRAKGDEVEGDKAG